MTMEAIAAALAGRFGPAAADITEQVQAGTVVVHSERGGSGAGTVWQPDLVITNAHVATGERAEVIANDRRLPARVVARDPSVDLAALHVEAGRFAPLAAGDSAALRVGQLVLAVGNPLGEVGVVTAGIISGLGGTMQGGPLRLDRTVQANITLRPGNSGGPLTDAAGRVVGINAMVLGPGVALAVPSNTVERFLAQHGPGGAVLGVAGQVVEIDREGTAGVLVTEVVDESAAAYAGLMIGDVLLAIDGAALHDGDQLGRALAGRRPGEPRRLAFLRGGRHREVTAVPRPREARW